MDGRMSFESSRDDDRPGLSRRRRLVQEVELLLGMRERHLPM